MTDEQNPVAWIDHHKDGDNLEWEDPGGKRSPLYTQAAIDAAVTAERERCAQLCEDIGDGYQAREARKWAELRSDAQTGAHDCAAAIRQAGEKT